MILTELEIQAMRGIKNLILAPLAPISVAVGTNNAGKSSILEAAALLLRPLDPSQWVQVARQRDFDMALIDGLWSLFPSGPPLDLEDGPKQSAPMRLRGHVHGAQRKLIATGLASLDLDFKESNELTLRVEARVDNHAKHTMEFRREIPAEFGQGVTFHRCFTVTPATHRSTRILVEHLSKAVDAGKKQLAVELLQLFDPDVRGLDVSATAGRDAVRVTHANRGVVDLASFGDGMRRSAALALALTRSSGGLLLIDELEAGIHPRALRHVLAKLISAASQAHVQILGTTHSLQAIDAIIEAVQHCPEEAALFHLRQGGEVHRYDGQRMIELRTSGLDLL